MSHENEKQEYGIRQRIVRRPLACICAAFSGAIMLSMCFFAGWQMLLLGGLLLFCGLALCLRKHPLLGAVLVAAAAGLWLCWLWHARVTTLDYQWAGRVEPLTVEAVEYPQPTQYGQCLETEIRTEGALRGVHLMLYVEDPHLSAKPGDRLEAVVCLKTAKGDEFPWQLYRYANGIFLTGTASSATVTEEETPWYLLPRIWAGEIQDSFCRLFPEEEAGFLLALTTGNTRLLSGRLDNALKRTGLRHIVAASGLHVSILTTVFLLLPGSRKRKGLVLLPVLIFFAALAGFTPSISRAVFMESILLLTPMAERQEDGLTSLALALAVILAKNPYAVAGVGLQLSFAAVLGLLTVAPPLQKRAKGKILKGLVTTLGANVFTLPLVICYFGNVSLLSPLSNLVVLWVIPILMPLAMLCALLGIFRLAAASALALLIGLPTRWLIQGILLLGQLPLASVSASSSLFLAWLMLAYLVGGLLLWRKLRGKTAVAAAAALILALVSCYFPPSDTHPGAAVRISVLDVGQGQCILLTTEEQTVVIDCGSQQERAGNALSEALEEGDRDTVDLLILTHYDSDHVNGLPELFETYPVERMVVPVPDEEHTETADSLRALATERGATVTVTTENILLSCQEMTLSVTAVGTGRNSGLVILASVGEFDLLVTGDADTEMETELTEHWELPPVEVLIAGHHGSRYATGETLLTAVSPQTVIVSVGDNAYGHPTAETLERCEAAGAEVWRTDMSGTLTVSIQPTSDH